MFKEDRQGPKFAVREGDPFMQGNVIPYEQPERAQYPHID